MRIIVKVASVLPGKYNNFVYCSKKISRGLMSAKWYSCSYPEMLARSSTSQKCHYVEKLSSFS